MTKSVTILLKNDGTMETEHDGFMGDSCLADLKKLKEFLKKNGVTVESEKTEMKHELMYASEETEQVKL
jgi:hypothetical protein